MARRCKYIDIMPSRLKLLDRIIFWTKIYCLIYKAARWYRTYLWSDLSMIDDRSEVGGAMSWHINACHRYGGHSEVGSSIEPLSDPTTTPRLQSDTHDPSDTQNNTHDPSDTQSDTHDKSNSHTIPPKYDFATLMSCNWISVLSAISRNFACPCQHHMSCKGY